MPARTVPDKSIRICADRGGTFCDVHASFPDPDNPKERKEIVVKLREYAQPECDCKWRTHQHVVSQDPSNYSDAPTEGIRRVLETVTGEQIPRGSVLNTDKIGEQSALLSLP